MPEYLPGPVEFIRNQVELYERTNGAEGATIGENALPVIIVYNIGNKTGGLRKTPLMRVKDGDNYVLIGSKGGTPENPVWVYNLRANPDIEIRDKDVQQPMRVHEVTDADERKRLWSVAVAAYPPYNDYQAKTTRKIPVFLAEPVAR